MWAWIDIHTYDLSQYNRIKLNISFQFLDTCWQMKMSSRPTVIIHRLCSYSRISKATSIYFCLAFWSIFRYFQIKKHTILGLPRITSIIITHLRNILLFSSNLSFLFCRPFRKQWKKLVRRVHLATMKKAENVAIVTIKSGVPLSIRMKISISIG